MPSPTPAADGSIPPLGQPLALPAADGSVLRCAILLRAVEITSKEDADPGTRELIARLSGESGETLERARLVVETGAGYFSAHGAAGTTMKALLEEGLACVTRYQIRASLVLLSEAKGAGATGREGPLKGYCDDLFRTYGMIAPSPTGFITQLNNHHRDDSTDYIKAVFEKLDYYYSRMTTVGCPASQTGSMYADSSALVAALRANNLELEAALARRPARAPEDDE